MSFSCWFMQKQPETFILCAWNFAILLGLQLDINGYFDYLKSIISCQISNSNTITVICIVVITLEVHAILYFCEPLKCYSHNFAFKVIKYYEIGFNTSIYDLLWTNWQTIIPFYIIDLLSFTNRGYVLTFTSAGNIVRIPITYNFMYWSNTK